ncbi:hypothetical protein PHYSODRAFT_329764 [Phytophthora sojae]|uniref:Amino acid transporter transmembrane domain-containing protein n=1 Tax=Phytophthora sojae (strain P6497) TaxID=1094619 RepID=G4Z8E7_PHYSP|nr:hypothetical protein PHYSODRAFT_329764 [Phytophthora sojae]EGZ21867.1 hypothetical protein PHYSODRAFT_329764 [Phytophthora sojae]|eukprot:XP_009524584.1 hypothetical protein PHYSODRAFT_329764 [Phytophthora sojae]
MTLVVSLEIDLAVLFSLPAMAFTLLEVTPEVPNATGGGRGDYCLEEMLVALLKMMFLEPAAGLKIPCIVAGVGYTFVAEVPDGAEAQHLRDVAWTAMLTKIGDSTEAAQEVGDNDLSPITWICAVLTLGFGLYLYGIDANLVRGSTSDFDNRRLWTVGIERAAFYAFPLLGSVMLKLKIIYSQKFDSLKDKIHYSLAALV